MGLFSTKYIINVSSTAYNMAGDENDRPNFIKGSIFGSTISNSSSLADDLIGSHFEGPGMKQRQFFRYANQKNLSGLPTTTILNNVSIDISVVEGQITVSPSPAGLTLSVFSAEVNDGDPQIWIEKWILENHPTRINDIWIGDYDSDTNTFSVEFLNNDFFSWINDGTFGPVFDIGKRYIVAKYIETLNDSEDTVVEGTSTTGVLTLPDLTDFTQESDTETFTPVTLQRERTTIYSYNNGDPDVIFENAVDADVVANLNTAEEVWKKEVIVDSSGIQVHGQRQWWYLTGTDTVGTGYSDVVVTQTDLGGGVIRTETATTTGEQVVPSWTTQYDTQEIYSGEVVGNEQVFIYEVGTGNAILDALVDEVDASSFQEFFPFMPIRINNVSITDDIYANVDNTATETNPELINSPPFGNGLYPEMSKAYRRAYQNKSFAALVDKVEDNESIGDIDYAYLMWGCSLNTKENACKKYIYKFFEQMATFQVAGSSGVMADMQAQVDAYDAALTAINNWESTLSSTYNELWDTLPPKPTLPKITPPATNTIRLNEDTLGFDIRLQWIDVTVEQFAGTYDSETGALEAPGKNDLEFAVGADFTWTERQTYNNRDGGYTQNFQRSIPSMVIYWQVSVDDPSVGTTAAYRKMTIWGLTHYNYIYGGKAVVITSKEALEDTDESGFIVPLHYPTMSNMGIVDFTQMSTANSWILFNSYTVTKQRWYQRGIFKILLVILIIVIAIVAFPGAFAAGGGILGGNLAVGAALGLTGTAALVAGVIANYIASMIISQLLSIVGTALFGEKWGSLFAVIVGFAFGAAISGVNIFSAEGLLGLGNAIANGYSGWVQGDINEIQKNLESGRETYEEEMDRIQQLLDALGGNDLNFNPIFLTDYGKRGNELGTKGYIPETADEFIRRTTMTGTDIVELTHAMVYDFVPVQQTLPRN